MFNIQMLNVKMIWSNSLMFDKVKLKDQVQGQTPGLSTVQVKMKVKFHFKVRIQKSKSDVSQTKG